MGVSNVAWVGVVCLSVSRSVGLSR